MVFVARKKLPRGLVELGLQLVTYRLAWCEAVAGGGCWPGIHFPCSQL